MKKENYLYSMETLPNTIVLKTFEVTFKGKLFPVELLRLQSNYAPEYYFFVTVDDKKTLLKRTYLRGEPFWIAGGVLSVEDSQQLGPEIERQLGNPLPPCETNNPFDYKGDIQITVEKIVLGELLIEKAKAPFSADLYYRIHTSVAIIEMAKLFYLGNLTSWVLNKPELEHQHFKKLTDLIDLYEERIGDKS